MSPGARPHPTATVTPGGARVRVESEQRLERVVLVVARRDGHTRRDPRGDDVVRDAAGQRAHDHLDVGRDRVARLVLNGAHRGTHRVGDVACVRGVAVGEQDAREPRGVDQLTRGPRADVAGADDERDASSLVHRKSGPSSSRQPPSVARQLALAAQPRDQSDQSGDPQHQQRSPKESHAGQCK